MEKREMSRSTAVFLAFLSGIAVVFSALELHGWHVYLALALIGAGLTVGVVGWSRK